MSKILLINMLLYVLYLISFTSLAVWTTVDKHHLTDGVSARIKHEQWASWWGIFSFFMFVLYFYVGSFDFFRVLFSVCFLFGYFLFLQVGLACYRLHLHFDHSGS